MTGNYLTEACLLFYCVVTAFIQATIFNGRAERGDKATIDHPAWGWAYAAYACLIIWAMHANWVLCLLAAGLIRELAFAPALNLWRKYPARRGFFYFNPNGASVIDRMIRTRERYIAVYAVSAVLFVIVQILISGT